MQCRNKLVIAEIYGCEKLSSLNALKVKHVIYNTLMSINNCPKHD